MNPSFNNSPLGQTSQEVQNEVISPRSLKVLRQTYMLLAANVLFSAFCAFLGMRAGFYMPPLVMLIGFFAASFAINHFRNSGWGIVILFAFTGFLGLAVSGTLSMFFQANMGGVVIKALVGTAVIFLSLSAYTLFTKTNFNFLGGFLFIGSLVAMLSVMGAMLFNMTILSVVGSAAFIMISSGYILYNTSQMIRGEQTNYIVMTMSLFVDIFNIFVSLLNLLSIFGGSRD